MELGGSETWTSGAKIDTRHTSTTRLAPCAHYLGFQVEWREGRVRRTTD